MMMEVDARGFSCPQPALMTSRAIETLKSDDEVVILLDSETAVENCTRIAEKSGCYISACKEGGITRLRLKKP
ncbi:MAG: hypothetical protein GQ565_13825 [Candidatus Aegiribacteria sp.]|nr:hypothetical protein [Candidatus Aegiribacteria sp.]